MANGIDIGKVSRESFENKDQKEREWMFFSGLARTQQMVSEIRNEYINHTKYCNKRYLSIRYRWIGLAVVVGFLALFALGFYNPEKAAEAAGIILRKVPVP